MSSPSSLSAERIASLRSPTPPVTADNPYLPLAKKWADEAWPIVRAVIHNPAADLKHVEHRRHAFWSVWSVFAAEGPYRRDAERRKEAFAVMDRWTLLFKKQPRGFWDFLAVLEAVNWVVAAGSAPDAVSTYLERLRPSTKQTYFKDNRPNVFTQQAATLSLMAKLYEAASPNDPEPAQWRTQVREVVEQLRANQWSGGAFPYAVVSGPGRNLGPDPHYFNFDATFLGRYWQLTGDLVALEMLRRMAGYSRAVTVCGKIPAAASHWVKQGWCNLNPATHQGPFHAPEILATLSRDPLTKGVANLRLRSPFSEFWTYYAMLFWDPDVPVQAVRDRCEFDLNDNGPALRAGTFDVVMPCRAWTDSTFAVTMSSAERNDFDAYLCASYLGLYETNMTWKPYPESKEDQPLFWPEGTFCMTTDVHLPCHASVVGRDWIAAGWRFTPRRAHKTRMTDTKCAQDSPAERIDLWFADRAGAGGAISLEALGETDGMEPLGWLRFSEPPEPTDNARIWRVKSLAFEIGGDLFTRFERLQLEGKPLKDGREGMRLSLDQPGPRPLQPGTRFHYTLSAWPEGGRGWRITEPRFAGSLASVTLRRDSDERVVLVYNRGDSPATYSPEHDMPAGFLSGEAGRATSVVVDQAQPVSLPPYALLVLMAR